MKQNLDPQKEDDALAMLEILWLHQQHNIENRELLVKVLQSPVEQVRLAAQKVAWFWSERETHKRGSTDSTISGMQFRTYYEPWWNPSDSVETNSSGTKEQKVSTEKAKKETTASSSASGSNLPPSKRVMLDKKGVGPVMDITLPDDIDSQLVAKGKQLFESSCISCHIADQKMVGPSPKGILERRSPEWIMNFIINPSEMLEKDPFAKELLKEFDGIPMIDLGMSRKEARAILEYFRTL